MENIYKHLADNANKIKLVLATVTRTEGSTPQKPGSSAIFSERGLIKGTIGGGVVEGRVQLSSPEALKSGRSTHFTYDLFNDISNKEEAICGGRITVLLDAKPTNSITAFRQLKDSIDRRIPGILITIVTEGESSSVMINRYWMSRTVIPDIPKELLDKITPFIEEPGINERRNDFREMKFSLTGEEPESVIFLEHVFPPERLIIAGAGHIGRSLAHIGNLLGFEVTVIDDRPEYASAENIPDADHIIVNDIGKAMKDLNKSDDTYVVIVTRGHKDDAEALKPCIGASLAYTGMIGSKRKVASMKQEFIEMGFATKDEWEKIYAPVGMDIGSQTVEEIAVSIAAQLVQVRNGKKQE